MQPKLEIIPSDLVTRVLDEAFDLLFKIGVKVLSYEARLLLEDAGAKRDGDVFKIPEKLIRKCLDTVPQEFFLFDGNGEPKVHYGGNTVQYDPGSSGVHILDAETGDHRPALTGDLVRLIKVAEMLPQYAAQSTAVVCNEVPKEISDLYRLYIVLFFSEKPIVTGSFSITTLGSMVEMLTIFSGTRRELVEKPRAIFDVCPTPPLIWSEFGGDNLVQLAKHNVPAQIISMPLAGVAAPVTLVGSVVQHAAETLSGIVIHQLANPGAPIVWGGAPSIFDMRTGTTPMGAIETMMIDVAYSQVGKSINLPTHAYMGASDSKIVDAQAGMESGISALMGALGGINMISGAGMLDFLACQSPEKLVVDAEAIAMSQRLLDGMHIHSDSLASVFYEGFNFKGEFLKQSATRELFKVEQLLPSGVIDRDSYRGWKASGSNDTFSRAKSRVIELVNSYQNPVKDLEKIKELTKYVKGLSQAAGMDSLPSLE